MNRLATGLFCLAPIVVFPVARAHGVAAPSFMGLGQLPGGYPSSYAYGVSADGMVAVGRGLDASYGNEAFRWKQTGGMAGIGQRPNGTGSVAWGASADGSVVVGDGYNAAHYFEGFRWTQGGGMIGLGFLPGGSTSNAYGVSADGSVVVGLGDDSEQQPRAFRWTQADGMVSLGLLRGGTLFSSAAAVSGDGSVVVGGADNASGETEAFRWTQSTGMTPLGFLTGGIARSGARAVSADGAVVVGDAGLPTANEAFRWTQATGMVGLGQLDGGNNSVALAASGNGSIIVGYADNGITHIQEPFVWNQTRGLHSLRDFLVNGLGLDLTGWALDSAYGVSADGLTIVGTGFHNGYDEGWIAHIPEPTCITLLGVAVGIVNLRLRRDH